MLNIDKLNRHHLELVLQLWQSIMGDEDNPRPAESMITDWHRELTESGEFPLKLMDSKWASNCDLCLAVDPNGDLYAICCRMRIFDPSVQEAVATAANDFEHAVELLH